MLAERQVELLPLGLGSRHDQQLVVGLLVLAQLLVARLDHLPRPVVQALLLGRELLGLALGPGQLGGQLLDLGQRRIALAFQRGFRRGGLGLFGLQRLELLGGAAQLGAQAFLRLSA